MKVACALGLGLMLLGSPLGYAGSGNDTSVKNQNVSLLKKRVLADLNSIQSIFEVKYAPAQWKAQWMGWSVETAMQQAKDKLEALQNPSLKACQQLLRDFFISACDYHVGVRFYSTEEAFLPFALRGAEGRYFFCAVDYRANVPFRAGDELITFDGRPVGEVVEQLRTETCGSNTYETDRSLAAMMLTHRSGAMGHEVPRGSLLITGIRKGESQETVARVTWDYEPEQIRDFALLGSTPPMCQVEGLVSPSKSRPLAAWLRESPLVNKYMLFHQWSPEVRKSQEGDEACWTLGGRSSYLPPLGKKVWSTYCEEAFDAYIFVTPNRKRIGYIRIPHYMCDSELVDEFGWIMNKFQKETDALVIDQLDNPGGSVFYLYALLATLTDKPLATPKHHIALTQEEVHTAVYLMPYLEAITDDESARAILGDEMGGYPIDYLFARLMKQFCLFIVDQWNHGKLYSDPTYLFGVDKIQPHPNYCYTKPILLLINSLDFSGGDFFPAILQDNHRALLMGERTAGAGGYVLRTTFPNYSGIKAFLLTGSLAERISKTPIENVGVQPDIAYTLTVGDLSNNYQPYCQAILETLETLVMKGERK